MDKTHSLFKWIIQHAQTNLTRTKKFGLNPEGYSIICLCLTGHEELFIKSLTQGKVKYKIYFPIQISTFP